MGRYRTLSRKPYAESYNDYYQKKNSISTLKFARSIVNTNKPTDNFILNCCKQKPVKSDDCYVAVFQSYASLMRLLKQQAFFDKCCNSCADVPLTLMNGLKSEICFDDFYKSVNHYSKNKCDNLYIRSVNECKEKLNHLFPYGYFNNNNKLPNISLKRKLYLRCDKKEPCPTYIFCKCNKNKEECKCSDYDVVFPFNDTFVTYTISGCDKPHVNGFLNNQNKVLQNDAMNAFSKYNTEI